jgi:hypothetical protein
MDGCPHGCYNLLVNKNKSEVQKMENVLEEIRKAEEKEMERKKAIAEKVGYTIGKLSIYFIAPLLIIATCKILKNYFDIIPILTYWQTFVVYFTYNYCFVHTTRKIKQIKN